MRVRDSKTPRFEFESQMVDFTKTRSSVEWMTSQRCCRCCCCCCCLLLLLLPAAGRAFGHDGVGGKFVWADPETGLSFALVRLQPVHLADLTNKKKPNIS
jgi:CubicO group peptidase (beta-lactamase class C family)